MPEPVTKEAQPGVRVDVGMLGTPAIWIVMQRPPDAALVKAQPLDLLHPQAPKREMSGTASSCRCSPRNFMSQPDMGDLVEDTPVPCRDARPLVEEQCAFLPQAVDKWLWCLL